MISSVHKIDDYRNKDEYYKAISSVKCDEVNNNTEESFLNNKIMST